MDVLILIFCLAVIGVAIALGYHPKHPVSLHDLQTAIQRADYRMQRAMESETDHDWYLAMVAKEDLEHLQREYSAQIKASSVATSGPSEIAGNRAHEL